MLRTGTMLLVSACCVLGQYTNPPYFRGTPNGWGKTAMQEGVAKYGRTSWFTVQEFQAGGKFKIAVGEGWEEAYPSEDKVVQQGAGVYRVGFNDWDKAVSATKMITFRCHNGETTFGQSVYVVGNTEDLGMWDPARGRKLQPTAYPTWTGELTVAATSNVEWKCVKRDEVDPTKDLVWQPGNNNAFHAVNDRETSGSFTSAPVPVPVPTNTPVPPVPPPTSTPVPPVPPPAGTVPVEFQCHNGETFFGQSVYVVGSIAELGNWAPASAVKLEPTEYPSWKKTIDVPANSNIQWKCIKRLEADHTVVEWQVGADNSLVTGTTMAYAVGHF